MSLSRNKVKAMAFLLTSGAIVIFVVTATILHEYRSKADYPPQPFGTEAWCKDSRPFKQRVAMLSDLMRRPLVGMTRNEVLNLLGPPNGDHKDTGLMVYCLGPERGSFIQIDDDWLRIQFHDGVVSKVDIAPD
jgi:hypothetical protein